MLTSEGVFQQIRERKLPFETLNQEIACRALAKVGLLFVPSEVHVESREDRWIVRLPERHLAWFAASSNGLQRLRTERRVLRLLEARCNFRIPRVLCESPDGQFDVRLMVPGESDPWRVYSEVCNSAELAEQIGRAVGAILADQHANVSADDVAGWLRRQPAWPEPSDWVRDRLSLVVDDPDLIARAETILGTYENISVSEADRALVHTDVGFHNLSTDPQSHAVQGLFDYDGAAWADRHHDFRYLVFDVDRYELLEAALSVYEPIVGHRILRPRVFLYNAACAVSFLAHRAGTEPEERSCGRTLFEDLRWSKHAIARALGESP